MITRVITSPQYKIESILGNNYMFDIQGLWALISIYHNPEKPVIKNAVDVSILKIAGCDKILSVCFGDYTSNEVIDLSNKYRTADKHLNIITEDQAKDIFNFIKDLKNDDQIKTLVVHCKAGISRSGAVGLYACRYYGLDEREFMRENSAIIPNFYVYGILSEMYNPVIDI